MSYLRFDKTVLINLEQSLHKEMLRTNKSGAYHLTTLVDCNTRKHHGLLAIPIPDLDDENHLLLSSLDETVIQHGAEFNLGLHKYANECYSPNGHKYIREYNCDVVPTTIYRVGGVVLSKEKIFTSHENRILIRYTLLEAHSETTLRFRPFLAFRKVSELTRENSAASKEYVECKNGVAVRMYEGYPHLYMQFNKKSNYVSVPVWHKNIEYFKEQERGYEYQEDLFVPGYLELPIKKGESIVFSAGISEVAPTKLKKMVEDEIAKRTPRVDFYSCLKNSAEQFYNLKPDHKLYLLAGYPWLKVRARDQFIALPGATICVNELQAFYDIMESSIVALRAFMRGEPSDPVITEIDQPDVLLWAVWAIQQYFKEVSFEEGSVRYSEFLYEVIDYLLENKHPGLYVCDNGLIYAEGRERAISWMHASIDGRPIIPRSGFLVEFNALWFNALCFVESIAETQQKKKRVDKLKKMIEKSSLSFIGKFKNQHGYLFDYVDGDEPHWDVRPNMLIAIAMEYSPLKKAERKVVLDFVTKELFTPKGIRSLTPKSGLYNPYHEGSHEQRYYAYHQGTAWPWLTGFYIEAYLKVFGHSGLFFVERALFGFEEDMRNHCIGSLPELYDGNPPFKARGAVSYAMNVAEVLRALSIIAKYTVNFDE